MSNYEHHSSVSVIFYNTLVIAAEGSSDLHKFPEQLGKVMTDFLAGSNVTQVRNNGAD
jgi:hypothetical protein